jgi:hypothetical protein
MATPKSELNRTVCKWAIDAVWFRLESISHHDTRIEGWWRDLNAATHKQEKAHRAWGSGLLSSFKAHHPKACSVQTAARYFAALAPLRDVPVISTWTEAASIRDDWCIGYAISEHLTAQGLWQRLQDAAIAKPIEYLKQIDYGEHLVR